MTDNPAQVYVDACIDNLEQYDLVYFWELATPYAPVEDMADIMLRQLIVCYNMGVSPRKAAMVVTGCMYQGLIAAMSIGNETRH